MSEIEQRFKTEAAWIAAHRLDLRKEPGIQIANLIAEALQSENDRGRMALAAKDAEIAALKAALYEIATDEEYRILSAEEAQSVARSALKEKADV